MLASHASACSLSPASAPAAQPLTRKSAISPPASSLGRAMRRVYTSSRSCRTVLLRCRVRATAAWAPAGAMPARWAGRISVTLTGRSRQLGVPSVPAAPAAQLCTAVRVPGTVYITNHEWVAGASSSSLHSLVVLLNIYTLADHIQYRRGVVSVVYISRFRPREAARPSVCGGPLCPHPSLPVCSALELPTMLCALLLQPRPTMSAVSSAGESKYKYAHPASAHLAVPRGASNPSGTCAWRAPGGAPLPPQRPCPPRAPSAPPSPRGSRSRGGYARGARRRAPPRTPPPPQTRPPRAQPSPPPQSPHRHRPQPTPLQHRPPTKQMPTRQRNPRKAKR